MKNSQSKSLRSCQQRTPRRKNLTKDYFWLKGGIVNQPALHVPRTSFINTNDEFNLKKREFVIIYETNLDMLYNTKELSPSRWKFGYFVTNRFTPSTRQELDYALSSMFPVPKNTITMRPTIDVDVLYNLGPLATWDTHLIKDMSYLSKFMHNEMDNTWPYDISNWNMQNVFTMCSMFCDCKELKRVDVSHWDTRKVQNLSLIHI